MRQLIGKNNLSQMNGNQLTENTPIHCNWWFNSFKKLVQIFLRRVVSVIYEESMLLDTTFCHYHEAFNTVHIQNEKCRVAWIADMLQQDAKVLRKGGSDSEKER